MARQSTATVKRPRTPTRRPATRKPGQQGAPKLRESEKQELARTEELEQLYQPLREAAEAELQKTKSGRKLLEETQALARELSELSEGKRAGKRSREADDLRMRERLEEFHDRYGAQFADAHARLAHLEPSPAAVARILRPEMTTQTLLSETSPRGSMLLQPKDTTPADAGTVTEGLDAPPLPEVHSCVTPPYGRKEEYMTWALIYGTAPFASSARPDRGKVEIGGNCLSTFLIHIDGFFSSAFVGQDFPVPPGPTDYEATISYDWWGWGGGVAVLGVAIVNVDLAIVIDKLDGTRETHAREVSLMSAPLISGDSFNHVSNGSKVSIPFKRDGLNGTVRIMVGADGQCTTAAFWADAFFAAYLNVNEICLTSVGNANFPAAFPSR